MRSITWRILQFVFFLGLAVFLTWLAFSGQDLDGLWAEISGANWVYLLLGLVVTLLGHWARAVRWRLLLRSAGERVRVVDALVSLLNGYFVNLGVPRLGEITRCGALNRLAGTSVLSAAGSVVAERAVDVFVLLSLVGLFLGFAGSRIQAFFQDNIGVATETLLSEKGGILLGLALIGLFGLVILFLLAKQGKSAGEKGLIAKAGNWAMSLWRGLVSALKLQKGQKWFFLLLTLIIWASYIAAPMLSLLALNLQGDSFWEVSFAVFLFGSLARTVPLPAGSMGAYHFIVAAVMVHYGYSEIQGLSLAALNHGLQTLFYLLAGAGSFAAFVWMQGRRVGASKTAV
ncbi:MAG TPA: flippase-like domain-containing protein [Bacteroidetes bacterium]|nr:flippase-like domain-containing protein [Bacteroidota bacterium]